MYSPHASQRVTKARMSSTSSDPRSSRRAASFRPVHQHALRHGQSILLASAAKGQPCASILGFTGGAFAHCIFACNVPSDVPLDPLHAGCCAQNLPSRERTGLSLQRSENPVGARLSRLGIRFWDTGAEQVGTELVQMSAAW